MKSQTGGDTEISGFKAPKWILPVLLVFLLGTLAGTASFAKAPPMVVDPSNVSHSQAWLNHQVYDRLVTLPWFGVFDNLAYKVQGNQLTLLGQVVFPLTRSSVVDSVKGLPGVTHIVNDVQQLSFSPFDNQIRRAEYRSIFGYEPLFRYSMGVNPSIHIIVNHSRVTLVGVVDSKADRELAGMRARLVPYVFSVKNDLTVA
ncbi:MAG: BON domain-containing protein [Acidobacteriota bacterium]|nr:BON domain-containing protein [Acidobacteriota bacterium]